jgi:hypothetical protein
MNIFLLDKNPDKCAKYHCDKHVVKMIVESAQMLCTAHWQTGSKAPYKPTHTNHPCNLWVRESLDNYIFLCKLALSLCKEYTLRYGKIHKSQDVIEWCVKNKPKIARRGLTKFALAMPESYKSNNAIKSYRDYYRNEKKDFLNYTKTKKPRWLKLSN